MEFPIINKLNIIENFQFLRSSLDSLVKISGKDDFTYLSQEVDTNILDLKSKKDFILMSI